MTQPIIADIDLEVETGGTNFVHPFSLSYCYSFVYDGHQESPLSVDITAFTSAASLDAVKVTFEFSGVTLSDRITAINIYRKYIKDDGTGDVNFKFIEELKIRPINKWVASADAGFYSKMFRDSNESGPSYESLVGISETITNTSINYSMSTTNDSYLFIAKCNSTFIAEDLKHYIFRSMPGNFSQFNWSQDYQILPEIPTAIMSYNGRLYLFSETKTYILNQASLQIEDVFEGAGCLNSDSVITTEYGMCYADTNAIYMHDGRTPTIISSSISTGSQDNYNTASTSHMAIGGLAK